MKKLLIMSFLLMSVLSIKAMDNPGGAGVPNAEAQAEAQAEAARLAQEALGNDGGEDDPEVANLQDDGQGPFRGEAGAPGGPDGNRRGSSLGAQGEDNDQGGVSSSDPDQEIWWLPGSFSDYFSELSTPKKVIAGCVAVIGGTYVTWKGVSYVFSKIASYWYPQKNVNKNTNVKKRRSMCCNN